jgi:hypothetical protein
MQSWLTKGKKSVPQTKKELFNIIKNSPKTQETIWNISTFYHIFGRFHKLFYFSKTNIKTFLKHPVNSNNQLKAGLSKEKQYFPCINQDTSSI